MTPHLDTPTLLERRIKAEATLLTLEREQGAALLDGADFDASTIAATKAKLAAIGAAELETFRRDEAEAAKQLGAARRQAAKDAREALSAYTEASTRCEAACKALVANLKAMKDAATILRGTTLVLGSRLPIPLEEREMHRVMSRLLAGELQEVGSPSGFGVLRWISIPRHPDWTETIVKHITPAVEAAIAKGTT